jgi:hypothetical protein
MLPPRSSGTGAATQVRDPSPSIPYELRAEHIGLYEVAFFNNKVQAELGSRLASDRSGPKIIQSCVMFGHTWSMLMFSVSRQLVCPLWHTVCVLLAVAKRQIRNSLVFKYLSYAHDISIFLNLSITTPLSFLIQRTQKPSLFSSDQRHPFYLYPYSLTSNQHHACLDSSLRPGLPPGSHDVPGR